MKKRRRAKIMVLKMIATNSPEEEIEDETLTRLKGELKNLKGGNIPCLSVEEFIELLENDKSKGRKGWD